MDGLGRIVIPKEMRNALGIKVGDGLAIECKGGLIQLRPVTSCCMACGSDDTLVVAGDHALCKSCLDKFTGILPVKR